LCWRRHRSRRRHDLDQARWLHQGGQDEGLRAQGRAGDRCGDD